jgi:RNA polymerase sigma factor (TIGR02999 family)
MQQTGRYSKKADTRGTGMSQITQLIEQGALDGGVAADALFTAAYSELQKLARARLHASGPMTLLDTSALITESWLRLSGQQALQVETRRKFFAYAAQVMRTVIVDLVRERNAERRGGGLPALTLNTAIGEGIAADDEALHVHEALQSLAQVEPRLAQVVEMRYYGGLTEVEIGEALGLTERTVRRDWEKARVLLAAMLA